MKVISSAPTRLSLFGGGSDLPVFYKDHGGAIVNMAINLHQEIDIKLLEYSANIFTGPTNSNKYFYKSFFEEMGVSWNAKQIVATSDAPIQSGLGSSASAAVSLVSSLAKIKKLKMTKEEIVNKAWDIEVNKIGLYGGKQDQIAATYGGFNFIEFDKNGFTVTPFDKDVSDFWSNRILLFFTGKVRKDTKIQEELKHLSQSQTNSLIFIKQSAIEAEILIREKRVEHVATLMNDMWREKKKLNPLVTNKQIDDIYDRGMKAGAMAGRLLGSGGGGFMAFLVEPDKHEYVIEELVDLKHFPFEIDHVGLETEVILEQ